ncbi:MAG TPA: hypothetical protein EYP14_15820, partial [Planctomycetaceae bacterium]|nr:hypothetical protein [Planctomycetaceae bacterium]
LFDRQLPILLGLPQPPMGQGQCVITAGDALVEFAPNRVSLASDGVTGLACLAWPEQASRHGVYCLDDEGRVLRFLQKPSLEEQALHGAVGPDGRTPLDVGIVAFDSDVAVALLDWCGAFESRERRSWSGPAARVIETLGFDFYREFCCALGRETSAEDYVGSVRRSGSEWPTDVLERLYRTLRLFPFHAHVLSPCRFLHFGTTRQLVASASELLQDANGLASRRQLVVMNSRIRRDAPRLNGKHAWLDSCQVNADVVFVGDNVVVGLDVERPVRLEQGQCVAVLPGRTRDGRPARFVLCYGSADQFKRTIGEGATFCNRPVLAWLGDIGADLTEAWPNAQPSDDLNLWHARLFPALTSPAV